MSKIWVGVGGGRLYRHFPQALLLRNLFLSSTMEWENRGVVK